MAVKTFYGLQKLNRKIRKMPDVVRKEIRRAMEGAAAEIVAMMKNLAPVDSGALRESIGWTWGSAPVGAAIIAKVRGRRSKDMSITIFAGDREAYYAKFQEFGTQSMPAQPYFYVSWRANRKHAKAAIRKATKRAVKQVAKSR